jgi:hypothetical protein
MVSFLVECGLWQLAASMWSMRLDEHVPFGTSAIPPGADTSLSATAVSILDRRLDLGYQTAVPTA